MQRRIWILNGPNLNLLGRREPEIYGNVPFEEYLTELRERYPEISIGYFQTNSEGALIDHLHKVGFDCEGIIFNPAAYTHTSIAIADAVKAIDAPVYEVHISDVQQREDYRQIAYLRPFCAGHIMGQGLKGYEMALRFLIGLDPFSI